MSDKVQLEDVYTDRNKVLKYMIKTFGQIKTQPDKDMSEITKLMGQALGSDIYTKCSGLAIADKIKKMELLINLCYAYYMTYLRSDFKTLILPKTDIQFDMLMAFAKKSRPDLDLLLHNKICATFKKIIQDPISTELLCSLPPFYVKYEIVERTDVLINDHFICYFQELLECVLKIKI